ncbi:protein-disulfide reductase DsbD [Endozoicomonas sp. G2_1]|uniref:protein-disulfide reductase DsbD n=1 Tax=Endozoicomonas sp. G2_1 TaxID=2821091 RepID=UPI001ADB56B9|nr:protein-disulfide reductase DsbD [Endozoicomonas sp. G2_1]MBO9489660.1 protein-disulfide reductase DsbD [Endozoicomonas sp. G2_1]
MKNFVRLFSLVSMLLLSQLASTQLSYAQESLFDTSSSSLFSNDDEFLTLEEAFVFDFFQKRDKLEVTFNIQEGYYLYRHQFKISAENADITPVELPAGIEHEDEFFGVQQIFKDSLEFVVDINQADANGVISIRYQGCAEKGLCYPPTTKKIDLSAVTASSDAVLNALAGEQKSTQVSATQTTDAKAAAGGESSEQFKLADMLASGNVWITLIAFFGGGLLLSFTPCVFPMYPILTGIIVGQGDNLSTKRAFSLSFFYVQGMAITYTLLGVVVALAGAQFQAMFQHPAVLIALSILFIFLALSMFGVFNLALPSSWQNKLNNLSNQQKSGSYKGVVAMGAISGLVASPCTTAPLTGALIYISQSGDIVLGASALYALSLGMGLPLLVLGSSGGKILPKAGNWMTVIKNIFGFLLLAVPVFLIERFIPAAAANVLWALLILSTATYFYVANSDSTKNFWFGLRSMVIFVMMFFGANLLYQTVLPNTGSHQASTESHEQHFTKVANLAELQSAVKEANANGKTVMLDLYADWCIACKEFEKYTFPTPQVQQALANSVLIQIDLTDTGSESSVELMGHFEVFGLPSILFFDLNGNELDLKRVTGFMGADEFAAHVNSTFNQ